MQRLRGGSILGALVLFAGHVPVSSVRAQEACSTYVVREGDTLGAISMEAYGDLRYQLLFNANVDALRGDPSVPPPNTELRIPCADGRMTAESAIPAIEVGMPADKPVVLAPEDTGEVTAYRPEIRIVSGDDWVPFADPTQSGGGLFLRITTTALDRAGPEYRHMTGWVADWESHIFVLLPNLAFDFATGWYDPNCASLVNPSERTTYMCENFIFSDPIYDSVFGFFSTPDNPFATAATFADLAGARLCRAEGNLFTDLEAEGLVEPIITISMEDEEELCLEGVLSGTYDVASFEVQFAPVAFASLGITDEVVQSPNLSTIQSSAVIAHKDNPRAAAFIAHLNRGLAMMRESGEWSDVVSSTLAEAETLEAAP